MRAAVANSLGTIGMMVTLALWLSLLRPHLADRIIDGLAGPQHEYKIVLGAAIIATVLAFVAAVMGSRWWYAGVALASGTLAFFVVNLWV